MERIRKGYPDLDGERFIACAIFGTGHLGDMSGWPWEADLIHFMRYGIALRVDLKRRERRDWKATNRVLQTERAYEELRCGRKPSLGKFKRDANHWLFVATLWNLGIAELNSEELADLFDWCCDCREDHFQVALTRQRARFRKIMTEAHEWNWSRFTKPEEFLAAASPHTASPPSWW